MLRNLHQLEALLLNLPTEVDGKPLGFDMAREWHDRDKGETPACGIGGWVLAMRPDLRRNWWLFGGPRTGESALRKIGCGWLQAMQLEVPRAPNRFGDFEMMDTSWMTAEDAAAAVGNVRVLGEPFWETIAEQARKRGRASA